ncbi:MAG: transcription repressor NadR [Firmicutes bacterium]|nr:transcription repressor NadR [Bacillota bacterium]
MNAEERRSGIQSLLLKSAKPCTGSELAANLGVSRQVIVQDIAILRARGEPIVATPQGYVMREAALGPGETRVVACSHGAGNVREELLTIVREGGEILDVIVEHPLYGEISGRLMLRSEADVDRFLSRMDRTRAILLSSLTGGVHLHTIRVPGPAAFSAILTALREKGYLLDEQ